MSKNRVCFSLLIRVEKRKISFGFKNPILKIFWKDTHTAWHDIDETNYQFVFVDSGAGYHIAHYVILDCNTFCTLISDSDCYNKIPCDSYIFFKKSLYFSFVSLTTWKIIQADRKSLATTGK